MDPVEFIVPQRPVSQQSRRRHRVREWQEIVAAHAREAARRRRRLGSVFDLKAVSSVLAAGLELRTELVYVSLSDAPRQDVLP
jgi:hypothetical protein